MHLLSTYELFCCRFLRASRFLAVVCLVTGPVLSAETLITKESLSVLYAKGLYEESALGYRLALRNEPENPVYLTGGMLSYMRTGKYSKALTLYERYSTLAYPQAEYLAIYAGLKEQKFQRLQYHSDRLKNTPLYDYGLLVTGSVYLEAGNTDQSIHYFANLSKNSGHPRVSQIARDVHSELLKYDESEEKSPWLAASMSAVLPGAGHFYSRQYMDGTLAFFWTAAFLGTGAVMYDLENRAGTGHGASIVAGIIGLMFYFSSAAGAYGAAHRYNVYHERRFQQKIRERFFNLDFIESTSGIEFKTGF